jgi:hypothetical protein
MNLNLIPIGALILVASAGAQQQTQRRANISGGGNENYGKCTIEVVVDGVAEVEINGANGVMRNLSGQPPQWRRFECNGVMPNNPAGFRFQGIDGRGRQDLIRNPNNGSAIVRIEDSDGGAEGYTFDIMWGGGYDNRTQGRPGSFAPGYVPSGGGGVAGGNRWTTAQAINACRDDIRQRAAERYGTPNVRFQNLRIDNNPGRRDWVMGSLRVPRDNRVHDFACSVNFDNGVIRWAQLDPPNGRFGDADRRADFGAVQNCERAIETRLRQRSMRSHQFGKVELDNNPGRNDWVVGNVQVDNHWYNFSCRVDVNTGVVRSADLDFR